MWLRMVGEFMSIYFFGLCMAVYLNYLSFTYIFISSFVSMTKYAGRKLKTVMWLRMAGEFMSTYFSRTDIWLMSHLLTADNRPGFQLKVDTYAFVYLLCTNQYVSISTFWNKTQGCNLTRLVWRTRIIFRFFSCVSIVHLLRRGEYVGICWNQLQLGFPWSSRVKNGLECYLLFRIPNLESGFAASLE